MSKIEICKKIILQAYYCALTYFTSYLFPKIKEAVFHYKDQFVSYLWNSIKEDAYTRAKEAVETVNTIFESADYQAKERIAVDMLFNKISLPIPLKLFKPLLKNMCRNKLHEIIKEHLKNVTSKINELA